MALSSRLCFAGTVTKYHGAGPRQYYILPVNSKFIGTLYQMSNGLYSRQRPRVRSALRGTAGHGKGWGTGQTRSQKMLERQYLAFLYLRQPGAYIWLMIIMEVIKKLTNGKR